jgi:hypothetical protein
MRKEALMMSNAKTAAALIGLLALSAGAQEFKWPSTGAAEMLGAAKDQPLPAVPSKARVILVKGSPTPQPSYLQQCRTPQRTGTWIWFGMAREQVCGAGRTSCPGLQCRQSKWTGFTPDCSRPGVCSEWAP